MLPQSLDFRKMRSTSCVMQNFKALTRSSACAWCRHSSSAYYTKYFDTVSAGDRGSLGRIRDYLMAIKTLVQVTRLCTEW